MRNPGILAIILMALLAVRLLSQIAGAALLLADLVFSAVFAILYLAALIGILKGQILGPALAIAISAIDILLGIAVASEFSAERLFGAIIVDIIIVVLAYRVYKTNSRSGKPGGYRYSK